MFGLEIHAQMPPKKKFRGATPGIGSIHLANNFSNLPASISDLKKGHILYLYMSLDKSRVAVVRRLFAQYPENDGNRNPKAVSSRINVVVNQTIKYKKLSNPSELEKYASICREPFQLGNGSDKQSSAEVFSSHDPPTTDCASTERSSANDCSSDLPQTSATPEGNPEEQIGIASTSGSSTVVSTRSSTQVLTPMKKKLKRRLNFVSTSKASLIKKHKAQIGQLRDQLRVPRRVTNQALKRKEEKIKSLKREIQNLKAKLKQVGEVNKNQELVKTKTELLNLKKTHQQLLQQRKNEPKRTKKPTAISTQKQRNLQKKLEESQDDVRALETENLLLKESLENIQQAVTYSKVDEKTYSGQTRMLVFECIVNKTPTGNIPNLVTKISARLGQPLDQVPQRSAVELMARELGAISELQTAEMLLKEKNVTIGFDATTQEDVHINGIHFTTENTCFAAAVDELPGGTAKDYAQHIFDTVNQLSETYCFFNEEEDYQETRSTIIKNISNVLSDRCAANHAAITIVNSEWNKSLNELNCHLHPLDTIASSMRAALKKHNAVKGKIFGNDCHAANIVVQINKLRYKNSKGDPRGFVAFLDEHHIPRGVLPRYRGNRLHIIFHNAGKLIENYDHFVSFFQQGTSCGGLREAIVNDFKMPEAKTQLQVLGLMGKFLSGPWMKAFYTSASNQINHVDAITTVKDVLSTLKQASLKKPEDLLTETKDFFGGDLQADTTLRALQEMPPHSSFPEMMGSCLKAAVDVIERQYHRYFSMDITEQLRREASSARTHNIDAEELMGMFSALKQKSPNATMCYLSSRMRACKNHTVSYLDSLNHQKRDDILHKAIKLGRKQRNRRKAKQKILKKEIIRRQKEKEHSREEKNRKALEKKLKEGSLEEVQECFPHLDYSKSDDLQELFNGRAVGRKACHVWYENQTLVLYRAKFEKLKNQVYKVAYWLDSEDYEDATDYNVTMFQLAADLLHGDLVFD